MRKVKRQMYQVVSLEVITRSGKKEVIKPRCELCKYAELTIDDNLICQHENISKFELYLCGS